MMRPFLLLQGTCPSDLYFMISADGLEDTSNGREDNLS